MHESVFFFGSDTTYTDEVRWSDDVKLAMQPRSHSPDRNTRLLHPGGMVYNYI